MSNFIPAGNLARLLTRTAEGDTLVIPIVGFIAPSLTNAIAFPVLLIGGKAGLTDRDGIVFTSDGLVSYPHKCMVFKNVDEFETYVDDHVTGDSAPVKNVVAPSAPTKPLNWGEETFKTKSFWHWEEANAVFSVEKGEVLPTDKRAVKIKRDEYDALRKSGAVQIDPHNGVIAKDAEPEAPAEVAEEEDYV